MPDDFDPLVERERMNQRMRDWDATHPQEKKAPTTYVSGATESFGESLKSCAYLIIGTIVIVVIVALTVNFLILHMVH